MTTTELRAFAELIAAAHGYEVREWRTYRGTIFAATTAGGVFITAISNDGDPFVFADIESQSIRLYPSTEAARAVIDKALGRLH